MIKVTFFFFRFRKSIFPISVQSSQKFNELITDFIVFFFFCFFLTNNASEIGTYSHSLYNIFGLPKSIPMPAHWIVFAIRVSSRENSIIYFRLICAALCIIIIKTQFKLNFEHLRFFLFFLFGSHFIQFYCYFSEFQPYRILFVSVAEFDLCALCIRVSFFFVAPCFVIRAQSTTANSASLFGIRVEWKKQGFWKLA